MYAGASTMRSGSAMLRQTALNFCERSAFGQTSSGFQIAPDTPFKDIGKEDVEP
jgi:hypothetical protein